uniref:Uncharacterized protein n=1 Tax=Avena sativa TaxID=4498 RepID=A0ACD5XV52_AVESA
MALLLVCLVAFLLAGTAVHAAGQDDFLSIDCGLDAALSGREDRVTKITYVSDGSYVDGGENHKIADDQVSSISSDAERTLRSFPSGLRNCYTLPTESGAKYLVRMVFFHGKYDGTPLSPVKFDLHLGTDYWDTVTIQTTARNFYSEAVFVAWASWVPVCLVNTGSGRPFVSTVELRPMGASLYVDVNTHQSMSNLLVRRTITNPPGRSVPC